MSIYQYFSAMSFCNTYLVADKESGQALLIDPGSVEIELIKLIESKCFSLTHVLLTHDHLAHREGLATLQKIYELTVWASVYGRYPFPYNSVAGGERFSLCNMEIEAIHTPGHSVDSIVWKVGGALFTGDVLLSGRIGSSGGFKEHQLLLSQIEEKLFSYDEHTLLFPGHGSPSKLRIEELFNSSLTHRHHDLKRF